MILLPAVDIVGGKAVRLDRGDFNAQTDYDADPLDAARRWVGEGARALHVVDLDGARTGQPANLAQIARIAEACGVPVEVGGGLRSIESIDDAISAGAASAILGTAALRDTRLLAAALERHGERIVVSVDARAGRVAAAGWLEQTDVSVSEALARLSADGVTRFIYSSIDRDGMLTGPDFGAVPAVAGAIDGSFVYSGGVAALADLEALAALREPRLTGVIVGKAIYERRFGVGEAQRLLDTLG